MDNSPSMCSVSSEEELPSGEVVAVSDDEASVEPSFPGAFSSIEIDGVESHSGSNVLL